MHAHLRHLVGQVWHAHARSAEPAAAAAAALTVQTAALDGETRALDGQLRALTAATSAARRSTGPFVGDMTIEAALRRHPAARAVLARRHLPACDRCAVRHDETVEEAAAAYGFSAQALIDELNALLVSHSPPATGA